MLPIPDNNIVKLSTLRSLLSQIPGIAVINGDHNTIVGVVKDFHTWSFHEAIAPIFISTISSDYFNCALKINREQFKGWNLPLQKPGKTFIPNTSINTLSWMNGRQTFTNWTS